MFTNTNQIHQWLKERLIDDYIIEDNLVVNVFQTVNISSQKLNEIPVQFGKIIGDFICAYNDLTSLKGCPSIVENDFDCHENKLTSLQYGPQYVGHDYHCDGNFLTHLQYIADNIDGDLWVNSSHLNK